MRTDEKSISGTRVSGNKFGQLFQPDTAAAAQYFGDQGRVAFLQPERQLMRRLLLLSAESACVWI
jgi:hypothetical protein